MPHLGRTLLVLGGRIVVHGPPGSVALLFGSSKKITPTTERLIETPHRALHYLRSKQVATAIPWRVLRREFILEQVEHSRDSTKGLLRNARRHKRLSQFLPQGPRRIGQDEKFRDAGIKRLFRAGKPHRRQVRFHQIAICQIQERRADLAVHHRLWVSEKILIVRTLRGTVGQHERCMSAAAGTTAPLCVVRRGRGNISHVDRVERRNVHAQFHRRRTEKDGEKPVGFTNLAQTFIRSGELAPFLFAETKTFFPDRAFFAIHLGRVLAGLKSEQWMCWSP